MVNIGCHKEGICGGTIHINASRARASTCVDVGDARAIFHCATYNHNDAKEGKNGDEGDEGEEGEAEGEAEGNRRKFERAGNTKDFTPMLIRKKKKKK